MIFLDPCERINVLEQFWGSSPFPKKHFFPKHWIFNHVWYILLPNLCKWNKTAFKFAVILNLIKFHDMSLNEDYWRSLKAMTALQKAIFYY